MAGDDLREPVRQRAYEIWETEGRPHGRDYMHWLRAEAEYREKLQPNLTAPKAKPRQKPSRGR